METPREKRLKQMKDKGYLDLTPEQRAERLKSGIEALKQYAENGKDMTKEKLQAIRHRAEMAESTLSTTKDWVTELQLCDALEQAQAEIGSYIDEKFWMEKRLERYRQLLNDTVGEINNVYLRKRICDMLEGAE